MYLSLKLSEHSELRKKRFDFKNNLYIRHTFNFKQLQKSTWSKNTME